MKKLTILTIICLCLVSACDSGKKKDDSLQATLWLGTSSEYHAIALQTYRNAGNRLPAALKEEAWSASVEQNGNYTDLPPAIIFDIDQTLLDNTAFKSKMIEKGIEFNWNDWADWINSAAVPMVPGALDYVNYAQSLGVKIFYVSNRREEFWDATEQNLRRHGFPLDSLSGNLLIKNKMRNWGEDKSGRRTFVAGSYRILQLLGDDLNDFVAAHLPLSDRKALVEKHRAFWGQKWFLLPNPLYGSWERALYDYNMALSDNRKRGLKYKHLSGHK